MCVFDALVSPSTHANSTTQPTGDFLHLSKLPGLRIRRGLRNRNVDCRNPALWTREPLLVKSAGKASPRRRSEEHNKLEELVPNDDDLEAGTSTSMRDEQFKISTTGRPRHIQIEIENKWTSQLQSATHPANRFTRTSVSTFPPSSSIFLCRHSSCTKAPNTASSPDQIQGPSIKKPKAAISNETP